MSLSDFYNGFRDDSLFCKGYIKGYKVKLQIKKSLRTLIPGAFSVLYNGGVGEIRTHGTRRGTTDFESVSL